MQKGDPEMINGNKTKRKRKRKRPNWTYLESNTMRQLRNMLRSLGGRPQGNESRAELVRQIRHRLSLRREPVKRQSPRPRPTAVRRVPWWAESVGEPDVDEWQYYRDYGWPPRHVPEPEQEPESEGMCWCVLYILVFVIGILFK